MLFSLLDSSLWSRSLATAKRRRQSPGACAYHDPDGKCLRRLERDPLAAPIVQRIFAEYLSGKVSTR